MVIRLESIEDARMFKKIIEKINKAGIDNIFETIEESINREDTADYFIISPQTMEIKE